MARGRKPGSEYNREEKQVGYIAVNDKLRIRVEVDCLILEEKFNKPDENGEITYGNYKYFTSWEGVLGWLIRRTATDKISKREIVPFKDARQEWLAAIKEVKGTLLGEINNAMESASDEIRNNINKFNR